MKILTTILLLFFSATLAFSQMPKQVDTVDYYIFGSMESLKKGSCKIDNKIYSKEDCTRIRNADVYSHYESEDYDNPTPKDLDFVRHKYPNGVVEHTEYSFVLEIGPFGEYTNYFSNGQVKSKWYFQEPNDSLTNYGIMEGKWLYFNQSGDTIGIKRFKDGMAHGVWYAQINDSAYVLREYKNGFSDGEWSYRKITKDGSLSYRPYPYHKGFYSSIYVCQDSFESFLDLDENIYQDEGWEIIQKIEYGKKEKTYYPKQYLSYIISGKFYVIIDGIYTGMKEFKDGELIRKIEYDYR